jgi:4-hydroxy-tetrahydrodipicolinate synthase
VNVLTTHSSWLLSSLVLGCSGLLSGSGSVIADLQAQLFRAVKAGKLEEAKTIHERITPTAEVFYAEPWVDMHNRMRPPLAKLSAQEIERIRLALVAAGLLGNKTTQRRVA